MSDKPVVKDSNKFLKIEGWALAISVAMFLTFVPILISAASTGLNILGVALAVLMVFWSYKLLVRLSNNN
jgi:hypothetical protein